MDSFSGNDGEPVPYGALLSIQNDTHFVVWPGSHLRVRSKQQEVISVPGLELSLGKGDMVLFRGDLVHAGASYKGSNIRLHAYLDHPAVTRHVG